MNKLSKSFFTSKEILFLGYSRRKDGIAKNIYQELVKNGFKVFPVNKADGQFDVKVYKSVDELPKVPEMAYILLNKENARKMIDTLKAKGVKKVLFQKASVDQDILDKCQSLGIETTVGCPLMVYGSGFHKLHAFFAGVK